ncbi:hypothetical protein [Polaribacter aestuariivivens]|uniref:hypothetical protein n=1 Tax=Polaribacter aestuariivivens TaxID=2304626 RepID=UPI001FEA5AC3|nr:hypothetical protein [Polaribacter aestuariivivens]
MKTKIAFFFSIIFISLLVTPTVISLTDATQDISYFLNFNEEEEEQKGNEESKVDLEVKIHHSFYLSGILSNVSSVIKDIRFHSKNYISEYSKITTPPPKFIL